MIGGFRMEGEPEVGKPEAAAEHGIAALQDFSAEQIERIDSVLGKTGQDLVTLNNFFLACEEDKIDTVEFVERLSILSKTQTPEEMDKLIKEWFEKVF